MASKEMQVAYGIDVDAVAGWLGSYGGEDSPDDIARGLFAGEIGTPRLLKLFDKQHLKLDFIQLCGIAHRSKKAFEQCARHLYQVGLLRRLPP